jgi:hypothetical protein
LRAARVAAPRNLAVGVVAARALQPAPAELGLEPGTDLDLDA